MEGLPWRRVSVDDRQELQPLLVAMARITGAEDRPDGSRFVEPCPPQPTVGREVSQRWTIALGGSPSAASR